MKLKEQIEKLEAEIEKYKEENKKLKALVESLKCRLQLTVSVANMEHYNGR